MKIIKGNRIVDAEAKGRTFGGTIIEDKDGERHWVGDKNNYYESLDPIHGNKTEILEESRPEHYFEPNGMMPRMNLLEALLGLAAGSVFIAALLCIGAVAGTFYAMTAAWPQMIGLIFGAYAQGAISVPLIIFTAAVIFLVYYFIRCIRKITKAGQTRAKRYAVICTACIAVPYMLIDLTSIGFSIPALLGRIVYGVCFALLPTIILGCLEYKASGGTHLMKRIAQALCGGKALMRRIFSVLGIAALAMSVIFMLFLLPSAGILNGLSAVAAFLLAGIFFLLVGIKGKE